MPSRNVATVNHKKPARRSVRLAPDVYISPCRKSRPIPRKTHVEFTLVKNINDDDDKEEEWTDEEPAPLPLKAPTSDPNAYFHWEDEDALFSDLLDEPASPDKSTLRLLALADSLQGPFDAESRALKREIASAFVPLVNKVKSIYASIDRGVDVPFGAGLLAMNDACKSAEKTEAEDAQKIKEASMTRKKRVNELLKQLEVAYASREQLWAHFERAIDERVNPVLEHLRNAPAQLERTIAAIEKEAKELEKKNANADAEITAQALKKILRRL